MFLGLRTIIYPAPDLETAKATVRGLLHIDPYFDEPFYVGFNVAGYELALDPNGDPAEGPITYWGVPNADDALRELLSNGSVERTPVVNVGDGIRAATVQVPGIGVVGIIENPHFHIANTNGDGPGR
jgi:hypothetical protein